MFDIDDVIIPTSSTLSLIYVITSSQSKGPAWRKVGRSWIAFVYVVNVYVNLKLFVLSNRSDNDRIIKRIQSSAFLEYDKVLYKYSDNLQYETKLKVKF